MIRGAAAERQLRVLVERLLRGVEERRAEAERDRTADDDEVEVEQVAHRRDGLADESPGALHDLVRRLGRRTPGDRLDRRTRRLGVEAATRPAQATATVRLDDRVADAAGVARRTVEQLTVQHDPALDRRADDHRQEVLPALRRAEPSFGEGQRLRIEVAVHVEAGRRRQAGAQRERSPRADVGRRDRDDVGTHRPGAADADGDRARVVVGPGPLELRLGDAR